MDALCYAHGAGSIGYMEVYTMWGTYHGLDYLYYFITSRKVHAIHTSRLHGWMSKLAVEEEIGELL